MRLGTTGLPPYDLVELIAVSVVDGALAAERSRQWLIQPPGLVHPRAARVHGHTTTSLSTLLTWEEIRVQVEAVLQDVWIATHSVHVDLRELTTHLPGWKPAGVVDTRRLAEATYPTVRDYRLESLVHGLGLDMSKAPGRPSRLPYQAFAIGSLLLSAARHYESWEGLAAAARPVEGASCRGQPP
ncbi:3'-5' exonuclease [Streptomyces nanshensis]|uniref:3'-5' exonuclease n=1 Tax=Streptomyces nanshensis TaxID=518642 RepID=UPI0023DDBBF4|nr:3'-5' exonuclease [Streptomyces nanshensis]